MPINVDIYNILLSCPSDVQNQIKNVHEIITEINQACEADGFRFQLRHWSKDVLINFGKPQVTINEQIVSDADAVIAIFGSKLGTPTTEHESGTVEEISIMAKKHKQIFVFFPKQIDLNVNIKEIERLQNFKKNYTGLYKEYNDEPDLQEKIRDQLRLYQIKIRKVHIAQKDSLNIEKPKTDSTSVVTAFLQNTEGIKLYKERSDINFKKLIETSEHEISIYNTSLNFMYQYIPSLIKVAHNKVNVKVLGLNPDNLFLVTRYHELGESRVENFYSEICTSVKNVYMTLNRVTQKDQIVKERCKVRLYANQPTYMMFQFDKCLIISFILGQGRSRDYSHIQFDLNKTETRDKTNVFTTDFEDIWSRAQELDENMVSKIDKAYNDSVQKIRLISELVSILNPKFFSSQT